MQLSTVSSSVIVLLLHFHYLEAAAEAVPNSRLLSNCWATAEAEQPERPVWGCVAMHWGFEATQKTTKK